jgi:hypothetical protein
MEDVLWSNQSRHNTGNRDLLMDNTMDTGRLPGTDPSSISASADVATFYPSTLIQRALSFGEPFTQRKVTLNLVNQEQTG